MQNFKQKIYNFLRRTQKYTKTDNVYLAKGGSWLSISQIGLMVIALGMGMAWARLVPKEVYGQYRYILSLAGMLSIFSLMGMTAALTRAVARGFDGTIKSVLKTKFRWSILGLLAGFFLALYYWFNDNQVLAISFLLSGLFIPLIDCFSIYGNYLSGKKRFDLQTKNFLAKTFLATAATLAVILLTDDVIYLILVYFLANAVLSIFFYFLTLKKVPPGPNIDQEAIKFGKHLSLISILGKISGRIDMLLVFHFLGAAELAIYSFAVILPNQISEITKSLKKLALPKLSARNAEEMQKTVWPRTLRYGLFLAAIIILYILFAGLIFKLLFPTYMESVFYSRIYAVSLLGATFFFPRLTFVARAKTKIIYIDKMLSNLIHILVVFISLYYFGLLGLMIGLIIQSLIINPIIVSLLFRSSYRQKA